MADFNNQCLFAILTHRLVDENPSVVLVDDLPIEHMPGCQTRTICYTKFV
jgi:hypothetical protein